MKLRNDWTMEEVEAIYNQSIMDLMFKAATVHRQYNDPNEVQVFTLLSIKTGNPNKKPNTIQEKASAKLTR